MASNPISRKWTVEEYLAYEGDMQFRYEYIDGEIYAMSGGTSNHSLIKVNCVTEFNIKTRDKSCRVYDSDMKVKVSDTKFVYPDFSVVCGERKFDDEKRSILTNPTLVAEVISDSSEKYDKVTKSEFYRSLPSLKYYLIIDQDRIHVQLYTLQANGWLLQEFTGENKIIALEHIDVKLPLREIYRDIEFDGG